MLLSNSGCTDCLLTRWVTGTGTQWKLAWGLANGAHAITPEVQSYVAVLLCKPSSSTETQAFATALAACQVQWSADVGLSQGSCITAVGSPFGTISPHHFANSIIHGVVSNCWSNPAGTGNAKGAQLVMADMRCLPGMEGGAVLDSSGCTVAMAMMPLLSTQFNAEVCAHLSKQHRPA